MSRVSKFPRLRAAGAAAIAAVAVFWSLNASASGSLHDLQLRRERIATLHAEAASLEEAAERARRTRVAIASLHAQAAALEEAVVLRSSPAETVRRVSALASESRLRLTRLTPAPVRVRPPFAEWSCSLTAEGSFADLETFFARLEAMRPPLSVDAFTLRRAVAPSGGALLLEARLQALTSSGTRPGSVATAVRVEGVHATRIVRDPFGDGTSAAPDAAPTRTGLLALRISDVVVQGVLVGGGNAAALLAAPDRRTYVARPGTELLDGRITAIANGFVTFVSRDEGGTEKDVVVGVARARR